MCLMLFELFSRTILGNVLRIDITLIYNPIWLFIFLFITKMYMFYSNLQVLNEVFTYPLATAGVPPGVQVRNMCF